MFGNRCFRKSYSSFILLFFTVLSLLASSSISLPVRTFADAPPPADLCPAGFKSSLCKSTPIGAVVGHVITYFSIAGAIIAVIFVALGGIKWIMSGGDKAKVEAARNTIIAAVIGLIVVFASYFLIDVVLHTLFGFNIQGGIPIPQLFQ